MDRSPTALLASVRISTPPELLAEHRYPAVPRAVSLDPLALDLALLDPRIDALLTPAPLRTDLAQPRAPTGADAAGFGAQGVPGRAAGVEDVLVARPETM
jgi:hypothetical protein